MARRLEETGVTANALHPGIVATNFGMSGGGIMPLFNRLMSVAMLRPEQGAQTGIYLAAPINFSVGILSTNLNLDKRFKLL